MTSWTDLADCNCFRFAALVGLLHVAKFIYRLVRVIVLIVLGHLFPTDLTKYGGDWVLITGASDGIGKEYAKRFAAKGLNIFLVARNMSKMQVTAAELEKINPKIKTHCFAMDFSSRENQIYTKLGEELNSLQYKIGILVNNVGIGYSGPVRLHEIENPELIDGLCNINMRSQCHVTRIVLPQMIKRSNGLIINISSLSGIMPSPLNNVYGCSKGFNNYFSEGLRYEYAAMGIKVQTVLPSWICTNLMFTRNGMAKPSIRTPAVGVFVKHAFSTIGWQDWTHGYWHHHFQAWITTLAPSKTAKMMMRAGIMKRNKVSKSE